MLVDKKNKFLIHFLYLFLISTAKIIATEHDNSLDAKRTYSTTSKELESDKRIKENEIKSQKIPSAVPVSQNQPKKLKFKIGFEFQLSHGIFPEALNNVQIQKNLFLMFLLSQIKVIQIKNP